MTRWIPAAAIAVLMLTAQAAYAQTAADARSARNAFPSGSIEGRVLDDANSPVAGAMVSVVGRTTAAASTDREGRYTLRELPYGPYILSVHSRGFFKSRGRTVQLTASKVALPEIQLSRAGKKPVISPAPVAAVPEAQTQTQLAGFGMQAPEASPAALPVVEAGEPEHEVAEDGETAWRLRHLPRSILKQAEEGGVWTGAPDEEAASTRWFARFRRRGGRTASAICRCRARST